MKKLLKKLKNSGGFTLAETLITVLILVMVAGVVAGGIPAAVTAFGKTVDAANAQVLLSTTVNALRTELCTAREVHLNGAGDLIYISTATGSKAKLYKGEDGEIMVQDFLKYDESGPQSTTSGKSNDPRRLITEKAATKNLQVTYDTCNWEKQDEVLVFHNLKVTRGKEDNKTDVVKIEELYIRCLGVNLTEPGALSGS